MCVKVPYIKQCTLGVDSPKFNVCNKFNSQTLRIASGIYETKYQIKFLIIGMKGNCFTFEKSMKYDNVKINTPEEVEGLRVIDY